MRMVNVTVRLAGLTTVAICLVALVCIYTYKR